MSFARILGRREVIALAFGAMVGWSWIFLTGTWVLRAGTIGAIAAFVIAGIVMVLIALTYAELAAAMPSVGGEHVYTERAFGRAISFVCTWSLLLGYVSIVAFEAVAFPEALSYLFPQLSVGKLWQIAGSDIYLSHVVIGIGTGALITAINVRGLVGAARLQTIVTTFILIAGIFLILGTILQFDVANLEPQFSGSIIGIGAVIVMLPLMFLGFDVIPQAAEEINLPPEKIGILIVVSLVIAVSFYTAMVAAVGFGLPGALRATSNLTTADTAARVWEGEWAAKIIVVGGLAGIVTSWNAFLVGSSRLMYALAKDQMLPRSLAVLHPRRSTPHYILWLIFAVSAVAPWFGRPVLVWLIDAGSLGVIIAYGVVAACFLKLRSAEPDMPRPYRVPYGRTVGILALVSSAGIGLLYLPWSPNALVWPQEWLIFGGWAMMGLLMFNAAKRAS
ncbi:MAG: amino acid permease [Pseudomonadota bacterium]